MYRYDGSDLVTAAVVSSQPWPHDPGSLDSRTEPAGDCGGSGSQVHVHTGQYIDNCPLAHFVALFQQSSNTVPMIGKKASSQNSNKDSPKFLSQIYPYLIRFLEFGMRYK